MSGIASRQNEILSKLGFNSYGAREFLPGNLDNEIVVPDINQYFSDNLYHLVKLILLYTTLSLTKPDVART